VQKWTVSVHGFDGYDRSVMITRQVGYMTYNFIGWIGLENGPMYTTPIRITRPNSFHILDLCKYMVHRY